MQDFVVAARFWRYHLSKNKYKIRDWLSQCGFLSIHFCVGEKFKNKKLTRHHLHPQILQLQIDFCKLIYLYLNYISIFTANGLFSAHFLRFPIIKWCFMFCCIFFPFFFCCWLFSLSCVYHVNVRPYILWIRIIFAFFFGWTSTICTIEIVLLLYMCTYVCRFGVFWRVKRCIFSLILFCCTVTVYHLCTKNIRIDNKYTRNEQKPSQLN